MFITPRTLSGFKDCLPQEAMAKKNLLQKVSEVFLKFGFVPIETPHLEYAEVLVKQGSDEIQKELYRFKDKGDRDVALRFDLTVPLARFIAQYQNQLQLPFKRFAIGNVFRGERAQKGRYREFTQCDFDFIGSDSLSCDAEILQVIYASLVNLDIDEFSILINHRKILNGICKHFGITQPQDVNATLRIIDKLDKIGEEGVLAELDSELGIKEQQAKEIALSQVPGQVVYVTKDIDLDHLGLEYNIKIKDKNNIIREVTVDSKYGAISDFENYYYND